jgi:hypothetical protein
MAANIPAPFYKSSSSNPVRNVVEIYNTAALTVATLNQFVVPYRCEIGQIVAYAGTAGTVSGSSVLDILVSHVNLTTGVYDTPTSIWTTAANRPTMLSLNTGLFSLARPDKSATSYGLALNVGDLINFTCASIGGGLGHALVCMSVALHIRG